MSVPCFIPSLNRGAQLFLLLESLEKNARGLFTPTIMYKYSNPEFQTGYNIVKDQTKYFDYNSHDEFNHHPELKIYWSEEDKNGTAEEIFYHFLEEAAVDDKVVCLFTDDSILFRPLTITQKGVEHLFSFGDLWNFQLRVGDNTTIQYYVDNSPAIPNKECMYRWDEGDFDSCHYFPCSFDGTFYKAKDLLDLSERKPFGKICYWEHLFCQQFKKNPPLHRPLIARPKEQKVMVQQVNVSHSERHNSTGKFNVSLQFLNDKLIKENMKIDLESMDFSKVNCTHGEISWEYKPL